MSETITTGYPIGWIVFGIVATYSAVWVFLALRGKR